VKGKGQGKGCQWHGMDDSGVDCVHCDRNTLARAKP